MKNILSNVIFGIVICVFGYLLVANILHVIYLNKYETFDFDSKPMTDIKTNIKTLKSNITKISQLNNKVLTKEEIKTVELTFNTALKDIEANKLLDYKGEQNIYLKDLFKLDLDNELSINGNIIMLEMLAKHDESINGYLEVYKYDFINNAYGSETEIQEVRQSYKYNSLDSFNANIMEPSHIRVLSRVCNLSYYAVKENYLAELVLKIGGGNNE